MQESHQVANPHQQDEYVPSYQSEQSYIHHPPTPRSNTTSDGMRTRSGRSARTQTDSPFSTSKSRTSKSPAPKKKDKKSKLDKSKTPRLTAPLSVLTKDMATPVRDIEAWVNRPVEERLKEVEKRNGYVTRPMNSFMLYRSAYAERTKQWCTQNNHQIVSSVSGESWPMEPDEVRDQFDLWAKTERQNHHDAHPTYKFSPSKAANKRRKGEMSDDEDELSDLDERNPDGAYRGGRNVRQRRHEQPEYMPATQGFDSHPYFGQNGGGYEQSQYQFVQPHRPLPSNVAYDHQGQPYNPQTNTYLQSGMHQQTQYQYVQELQPRMSTPNQQGLGGLGGYGLPGGQAPAEDLYTSSRTSTPMQHYQQYNQQSFPQYQQQYQQQAFQAASTPPPAAQLYEHRQYLQQASMPQAAIDPSLGLDQSVQGAGGLPESHFSDALGDFTAADLEGIEYYNQPTSPNDVHATLAPTWSPGDEMT